MRSNCHNHLFCLSHKHISADKIPGIFPNTAAKAMVSYFRPVYKDATYPVDLQPYPSGVPDFGKQRIHLKINGTHLFSIYKRQ